MALGLEQAIAEYLGAKGFGGLYDDADISNRVIFVQERAPAPVSDPAEPGARTTAALAISVFVGPGEPRASGLVEERDVTIECRHLAYETAMQKQTQLHALLNENGGQSGTINPNATGDFGGVSVIWIRATTMPELVGRDSKEEGGRFVTQQSFRAQTKPITLSQ